MRTIVVLFSVFLFFSCHTSPHEKRTVPVIGFLDAFEDATIAQARHGFYDALAHHGFSESNGSVKIIYRNAQGDIPLLAQACDYFIAEQVDLIAACPTLSTVTAVQKTKMIPVCMMVAPEPHIAGLAGMHDRVPANLFGVYETLDYIDTSVTLIHSAFPEAKRVGTVYNQSEPNSVNAFNRVKGQCEKSGMEIVALPVNSSSEAQLVIQALLAKGIDAFFALPDNTIFSSFEVVAKSCAQAQVPVFTSEAGLVARGALAAFGADMYQWGYQAGEQAAQFLANKKSQYPVPEIVRVRKKVYNPVVAQHFKIMFANEFEAVK